MTARNLSLALLVAVVGLVLLRGGVNEVRRINAVAGEYEMVFPGWDTLEAPRVAITLRTDKRWTTVIAFPGPNGGVAGRDSGDFSIDKVTVKLFSGPGRPRIYTVSGDTLFSRTARMAEELRRITGRNISGREDIFVRTSKLPATEDR